MGNAKGSFAKFIIHAEHYELPVGFLRYVSHSSYSYSSSGSSSMVFPVLNHMVIEQSALESGAHLSVALPVGEGPAVRTIYHETTHAWLDLKEDDPEVVSLREHGEKYYKDAPLLRGAAKADDPARVFQEAIASYVGHRAASYWSALEMLTIVKELSAKGIEPQKRAQLVRMARTARADYEKDMAARVFGYQNGPGWFSAFREQNDTTKAISGKMKAFCDNVLLEAKIPSHFDLKAPLAALWKELRSRFYPDLG